MNVKLSALLVIASLSLGLVTLSGCGESAGQKAARQANSNIDQMRNLSTQLHGDNIDIDTTGTSDQSRTLPARVSSSPEKLSNDRNLLNQYVSLGQNVLATAMRSDVNVHKSKDRPDIVASIQNGVKDAKFWLSKIDDRLGESDQPNRH